MAQKDRIIEEISFFKQFFFVLLATALAVAGWLALNIEIVKANFLALAVSAELSLLVTIWKFYGGLRDRMKSLELL